MKNHLSNILESTKYVVDNADFVKINKSKLNKIAESFIIQTNKSWLSESPFPIGDLTNEEKLMFAVIFNGLSFSYWGNPYWNVDYKGVLHTRGSWSLVACIFRSIEDGRSLLDPYKIKTISVDNLNELLRGNTPIPLIQERHKIVNKIGMVICDEFGGVFSNFMNKYGSESGVLLDAIIDHFEPAFDDFGIYKGKEVFFDKRAQALIESIHSIFEGSGYGNIKNIENLTALADYIIPNLLRNAGILEYSIELINIIDSETLIEKGSSYEIEIRSATIWVVEMLRLKLISMGFKSNAQTINDYLWTIGRSVNTPFHKVRTTAY